MSADIVPFAFEDHLVRVVLRQGEPWFIAADVCRALGIKNAAQAVGPLDDDEKGLSKTYTLGGEQEMVIVSEGGMYTLTLRSHGAITPGSVAHRFRKWVTGEVLPQIRRTGRYAAEGEGGALEPAQESMGPLSEVSVRARLVEIAERLSGKAAARALWRQLGLPWVSEMDPQGHIVADADDAVARFAVEGVEQVRGVITPAAMLWPAFCSFCEQKGLMNPGEKSFFTRFGRMGFSKRKSYGRSVYHNIRPSGLREAEGGGGSGGI